MRTLSANLTTLLNAQPIDVFYLVRVNKTQAAIAAVGTPLTVGYVAPRSAVTAYKTTTHNSPVTVTGEADEYSNDGSLVAIDAPRLTAIVDREQFKISLADAALVMGYALEAGGGITGIELEVRAGFVVPQSLVASLGFNITTNPADLLTVYKGTVEAYAYQIDTNNVGSVIVTLTGSSPMNNLDQKRFVELSKQASRARKNTDNSCDQLYEGSAAITVRWGKVG